MDLSEVLVNVDHLLDVIDTESQEIAFSSTRNRGKGTAFALNDPIGTIQESVQAPKDGLAEIRISADKLEVFADFFPPVAGGKPLSADEFWLLLQEKGIIHGVLHEEILNTLEDVAFNLRVREAVLIGRGNAPIPHLPTRTEILQTLAERGPEMLDDLTVKDYKSDSPFIVVKKGDLLAQTTEEQQGVPGKDVYGNPISFPQIRAKPLVAGRNVVSVDGGLAAGCDGSFRFEGERLWVEPILVLDSGVDYTTGHIDFLGDIHIRGEIASGFRIQAQGSIFSNRVIDATEILSGGDVVTSLGIIGRGNAVVKVDGNVKAKFLENVTVVSRGALEIRSSVLNCLVQTLDRLVMGNKGLVLGGKVQAQNGIDVFQIGSDRGIKAEITCGMDFSVLNKVVWARDQSLSLVKQMKVLENYRGTHSAQTETIEKALLKMRTQVRKLSELARELVGKIDQNEEAEVVVRGAVYPGTYIEICHVTHVVGRLASRVKFLLDKRRGLIQMVPI